ncbi:MAG: TetR/AcrR family transcriptional regulator [Sulfitobacter sp.]
MVSDTKTALLDSAERAARSLGFDGFSYADLAEDVGIRKASIHHHFPSKAKLSVELMQRYCTTFETVCAEIDAAETTGGARLRALIGRYRNALQGGKSLCLCVSFSTSRESLPPEVIAQIGLFRALMLGWIETTFQLGKADGSIIAVNDAGLEAAAALALLEGAQLAARPQEDPALFDSALSLLSQRIAK